MCKLAGDVEIVEASLSSGRVVEAELLKSLQEILPQAENTSFVLTATQAENILVGGLTASTSYGWLLVKTLWVDNAYRQRGIGRALLSAAHEKARMAACHSAWLDTSNPKAMHFYLNSGYVVFAQLNNDRGQMPRDHRRWFMKRSI